MAGQGGVVRCLNCKTVPRADTIAVPVHTCTAGFPRLRIFSTVFDTCLYLQRDGPHVFIHAVDRNPQSKCQFKVRQWSNNGLNL